MWNEDNGKSDIPRNLIVSRIWSWQEIYKARNTENKPKQIHTAVSRNLIVSAKPPLTLRAILDTLWWSWVKKSFPTSIEMYVGGLIYQEQLVATSFQWAEALQRFCSRSQGVVALVSVSDGKIQITILILRRGALSMETWLQSLVLGNYSAVSAPSLASSSSACPSPSSATASPSSTRGRSVGRRTTAPTWRESRRACSHCNSVRRRVFSQPGGSELEMKYNFLSLIGFLFEVIVNSS